MFKGLADQQVPLVSKVRQDRRALQVPAVYRVLADQQALQALQVFKEHRAQQVLLEPVAYKALVVRLV